MTMPPPRGHNAGPPLEDDDDPAGWRLGCRRRAHRRAWTTLPREIALRRLARAEELGMTYRDDAREILERGRHL